MAENLLQVDRLKTCFYTKKGVTCAVDEVSFTVGRGEILGIVGESGCGKSVTSLSIMGLLNTSGKIEAGSSIILGGKQLAGADREFMRTIRGNEIAMIFQDPMSSLNPVMKIEKQITETIRAHNKIGLKEARKIALDMLKKVGIPSPQERLKEYPHQLSGGMKQRVMIAMALCCNPSLLIADEPTTALDVTIQAQILDLMRTLRDSTNAAVILITHDMGVVAEMADNILVMYAGQVVEYAPAESMFDSPMHPYTRGLLASIPRLDIQTEKLYAISGAVPGQNDMPQGCRFGPRCEYAMPVCKDTMPQIAEKDGRQVRCFLYGGERQ